MADDTKIDAFSKHEALHTASLVVSFFDENVLDHRYVQSDPELLEAASAASDAIAALYQLLGSKTL